jgi:uncharacterized protein (DUF58 family)
MKNVSTLEPDKILEEAHRNSRKIVEDLRFLLFYKKIVNGRGLDFQRLREYFPGDDISRVDWNSLARTGDLYTKVFREDRVVDVVFLVDLSDSMTVGSTEFLKNEYASILVTTLADAAVETGDKAGVIGFSDERKFSLKASAEEEVPYEAAKALSRPKVFGGEMDWEEASESIFQEVPSDTFLFIVSDFVSPGEELKDFLKRCDEELLGYFCLMVRDPLDSELPEGVGKAYLSHPSTGEVQLVDVDDVREEYNSRARQNEAELKMEVESSGNYFLKTLTDRNFVSEMAGFLDRKVRKWR